MTRILSLLPNGFGANIVLPVRFVGVGEGVSDLREFHAGEFVEALFSET